MKRLIMTLGCAVLVVAGPAIAQTKTVKGSVKEVGANTITNRIKNSKPTNFPRANIMTAPISKPKVQMPLFAKISLPKKCGIDSPGLSSRLSKME